MIDKPCSFLNDIPDDPMLQEDCKHQTAKCILPNMCLPQDSDLLAWAYDPILATTATEPSVQTLHIDRVSIHCEIKVNAIRLAVSSISTSLINCFLGIYNGEGKLLAQTSDISDGFEQLGLSTFLLQSPLVLCPDNYYLALLINGLDSPGLWSRADGFVSIVEQAGPALLSFDIPGPHTLLPASIDFGVAADGTAPYWAGLTKLYLPG